jgi:type I restriction enzyme S subunit
VERFEVAPVEIERLRLETGDLLVVEGNGSLGQIGRNAVFYGDGQEWVHQNHIIRVRLDQNAVIPEFAGAYLNSPYGAAELVAKAQTTSGLYTLSPGKVAALEIPLAPLSVQERIVRRLDEMQQATQRAQASAEVQRGAASRLAVAILKALFETSEAKAWPRDQLANIAILLPSKSVSKEGEVTVPIVTTACLTEEGFDSKGIKMARMREADVVEATISPGEILVARSNTPALVGRVAVFPGGRHPAVASDLTIRIWPREGLRPSFAAGYLSYLYSTGYWRVRAGGASGSMKKITREQLIREAVPVPPLHTQTRVAARIEDWMATVSRLRASVDAHSCVIEALPAALLRRAFDGAL